MATTTMGVAVGGRYGRTCGGNPLVQALVGCYRDEGGPEAVRAVLSWGGRVWVRVCSALSAVARELSPVLVQDRGVVVQASPTIPPVAEQAPDVAVPLLDLAPVQVAHLQRLTPVPPVAEPVREVPTAVQRLEAERVTPPVVAEVVYWKCKGRYAVASAEVAASGTTLYRKVAHGKAARYHAV